jgi:hypothetical protein
VVFARRLFGALAIGLFLPGCPLTDHYYIDRDSGAAAAGVLPDGTSGLGGTFLGAGGSDGVGGDAPHGDAGAGEADGTGASTSDPGPGFETGGDTSVGGTLPAGGAGGTMVDGKGGMPPMDGRGGRRSGPGGMPSGGNSEIGGEMTGTGGAMAGSPGAGMSGAGAYQPVCDDSIVKGATCARSSTQLCYRACGPNGVGFKSETCTRGAYDEGDCQFPASGDYSCYAVLAPYHLPAACPTAVPRAADTCDVPACTPCFGGATNNPQYQDSTGAQKTGYCVCNDAGIWTCATSTDPSSWPCPGNPGCN